MLPNPDPEPNPWFNLFGSKLEVPDVELASVPPNPPEPKLALAALGSTGKETRSESHSRSENHRVFLLTHL